MNIVLIILSSILILASKPAAASDRPLVVFEGKKKEANKQAIITTKITSKTIELHRLQGRIDFNDNALIEREDTSFLADKIIVYYHQEKNDKTIFQERAKGGRKNQGSSIERIDALNNVKIFQEEFVATGDVGSYDPKSGIFTIEQNVIFNSGGSVANGDKFIYDTNTKKGYLAGKKNYLRKNNDIQFKDGRATIILDQNDERIKKKKNKNNKEPENKELKNE